MNVTLTVSTWNFKHLGAYGDPARAIQEIRRLGLSAELWLNWEAAPAFYDRENWENLQALVGSPAALSLHSRNDRSRLLEEIELLGFLCGRVLVVHPVALSEPDFRGERPARHPDVPFIRELAGAAKEHGVFLALENIFARAFLDRTLERVETFEGRGGLGVCVDVGHAELRRDQPGESAPELIADYGRCLLHLHVHDVRDGSDHLPLGSGSIDYSAVAAALREARFEGTAALEIQSQDPSATARDSVKYLGQFIGPELTVTL